MTRSPRDVRRLRAVGVQEVAREAGVSVASVSRVVNMPDKVGAEVRRRVEAAIDKLHYIPSGAGRALTTRRTRIIGALGPHIAYAIYSAVIEAVQRRLALDQYNLVLGLAGYGRENEYAELRRLIMAGAEAIMLSGEQRDPAVYRVLQAKRIPYVLNSVYHPDSPHPCVGYDNQGLTRQLTSHLLDLGHRRIAVMAGPWADIDRFGERLAGIREALTQRGLRLRDEWVLPAEPTIAGGRVAFRQLMAGSPVPTALICVTDEHALGALLEAHTMGVQVPKELSITGFGDHELAAQTSPSLTTVRIPVEEMSARIGDYLLGRLRGEPVLHATKVEASIVLRESTGPAPVRKRR
jgi:LacI family transcriptional regulator, galactose operon repressor